MVGVLTFVLELGAPLALFGRRLALGWVLFVYGMHVSIFIMMEVTFRYQLWGIAFLSFLPLERLDDAIRRGMDRLRGRGRDAPPAARITAETEPA